MASGGEEINFTNVSSKGTKLPATGRALTLQTTLQTMYSIRALLGQQRVILTMYCHMARIACQPVPVWEMCLGCTPITCISLQPTPARTSLSTPLMFRPSSCQLFSLSREHYCGLIGRYLILVFLIIIL